MKLEPAGLRGRIAAALTLLPVAAAALVALAFWLGEEYLERDSLRRLADSESPSATMPAEERYLAHYEDLKRRRGTWIAALLFAGTGAVGLTAWWLAGRLAQRSLRPLRELVEQIEGIDLERRDHRLRLEGGDPELQVIVSALNAHMAELDALVQRERAFAAAASHELRTPLAVIGGAAAVLAATQAPAPVLARIERAVAQARQDLEALLALSRDRGRTPATPQRLDQLLPEIAAVQLDADAGGTRVQWDVPAPVECEVAVGPLSIIFGNLLRNALRAASGGEVRISVAADCIRVTDDGPGLPPALLRGDALSAATPRRDGGSGMGLYIAQTLARREGWTITLKPAPGRGACAELHLGTPV